MKKKTLRGELLIWTFIAGIVPFIIGSLYIEKTVSKQVREDFGAYAQSVVSKVHTRINDGAIKPAFEAVTLLGTDNTVVKMVGDIGSRQITVSDKLDHNFSKYARIFSEMMGIGLGTEQGGYFEYPSYFTEPGYDPRTRPWYQEAMKHNGAYLTDPYIMHTTGEMVMSVAKVVEKDGVPIGVVVAGWNLIEIQKEVEELKIGLSGYVMVLNNNNKIIVSPRNKDWLMKTPDELGLPAILSNEANGNIQKVTLEGKPQLICVNKSEESGWKVIAVMEEEELHKKVSAIVFPVLLTYFATLVSILGFIFIVTQRYVVGPIRSLQEGAAAIADGNLTARVKNQEHDEFGILATAFNHMAGALQDSFAKIQEQNVMLYKREKEFQTLVENAQDIILRIDRQGRITYINPVFGLYSSQPVEALFGQNFKILGMPELFQKKVEAMLQLDKPGIQEQVVEFGFTARAGSVYWLQAHIIPEFYDRQQPDTILSVIRNITQQREMEKQIARLDKLSLVGEMAAGLAHEVRNPMTTVRGFLQMLARKNPDSPNLAYYDIMIAELDRTDGIIKEYLSLAKNKAIHRAPANLNDIIRAIAPLMQADATIHNKEVCLQLEEIPDLLLDKQEIHQLLLNMVRNGLEAMPEKGTVCIKTYREGMDVVLSVADQGTGIKKEVLEHLGIPFHTTKDNGIGLGLAVCYSIAARHQAQIRVESSNQGTEFFVRFPVLV